MLKNLLDTGFFEISGERSLGIRRFRFYETYKGIPFRVIVILENDQLRIEQIFFNSHESENLKKEFFGNDITVDSMIETIREFQKINQSPFCNGEGPETG